MREPNTITQPHPAAPRRLWSLYRRKKGNCSAVGKELGINPAHVWNLLRNGREPKRDDLRQKLFLRVKKKARKEVVKPLPEYLKEWNKLPKSERHKVIQQYLNWRRVHVKDDHPGTSAVSQGA